MNIYFDKSLKGQFLDAQKLGVDKEGYVIDKLDDKRIIDDTNKNYVKVKNFGGFRKGSRKFLSSDITTVISEAKLDTNSNGPIKPTQKTNS